MAAMMMVREKKEVQKLTQEQLANLALVKIYFYSRAQFNICVSSKLVSCFNMYDTCSKDFFELIVGGRLSIPSSSLVFSIEKPSNGF